MRLLPVTIFLLLLILPSNCFAEYLRTEYAIVFFNGEKEVTEYAQRIRHPIRPAILNNEVTGDVVAERTDFVFKMVMKALGIDVGTQKTLIQIYPTIERLRDEYVKIVPVEYQLKKERVGAFYFHPTKTIYYSLDMLDFEIAAHETAHAVMDHYFVRRVPSEMDEFVAKKLAEIL